MQEFFKEFWKRGLVGSNLLEKIQYKIILNCYFDKDRSNTQNPSTLDPALLDFV